MSRRQRQMLATLLLLAGGVLTVQGCWIHAKALLAQLLLDTAWARSDADGQPHRPWPWADHYPVAQLTIPALGTRWVVLEGDAGNVLAFAPGRTPASGLPGDGRTMIISGHRDTIFRRLGALHDGDLIHVRRDGRDWSYRVAGQRVVDVRNERLAIRPDGALDLVTCWPFDSLGVATPYRYVVSAEPVDGA